MEIFKNQENIAFYIQIYTIKNGHSIASHKKISIQQLSKLSVNFMGFIINQNLSEILA